VNLILQVLKLLLTATANKVITGDSATIQVYFIHDEFGLNGMDESGDVSK
jgi:hypothetical protein